MLIIYPLRHYHRPQILRLSIDIALGALCGLAGGCWVKCHGYTAARLKRWRLRESQPEATRGWPWVAVVVVIGLKKKSPGTVGNDMMLCNFDGYIMLYEL